MTDFKTQSAGYLANHMARLFEKGLYRRIEPLGLAPAQFMTLLVLWDQDGITQQTLRLHLDVEQATMANTLKRMERDGLITRRAHKSDKRARLVYLTDKAREMRDGALSAAKAQNKIALGSLSASERAQLVSLMQRVIGQMKTPNAS
ncbi:MarR family winged helix-turn-helix transcriptional regulator [Profundibacter amoris]|uniref:MarR family transcriptional regulator n=1 Tax=Profundibacter amoris TaxID=2171755 RepID=A0A347UE71_9RHOB|nr:MarR family transcriptional regulator [Profundibacter amoris]AXX97149.1 MarR family transcriptional regulator [Profundibacter amoris]